MASMLYLRGFFGTRQQWDWQQGSQNNRRFHFDVKLKLIMLIKLETSPEFQLMNHHSNTQNFW
jgi:hypothetical protein